MTFLISAGLAIWWMEVFKRPDYFCLTVRLSGSQLAVRGEGLGRWCKVWRWPCWDRKGCVWGFVYFTVCAYEPLCLQVKSGVKESPMWCSAPPWLIALWANSPVLGLGLTITIFYTTRNTCFFFFFFCYKVWKVWLIVIKSSIFISH